MLITNLLSVLQPMQRYTVQRPPQPLQLMLPSWLVRCPAIYSVEAKPTNLTPLLYPCGDYLINLHVLIFVLNRMLSNAGQCNVLAGVALASDAATAAGKLCTACSPESHECGPDGGPSHLHTHHCNIRQFSN